jgi:hypothetical protein
MIDNSVNRPAIVQSVDRTRQAMIDRCKTIAANVRLHRRQSLESAIDLGKELIELKKLTKHGHWLHTLEEINVTRKSAAEYQRFAKCNPGLHLEDCGSISEARNLLQLSDEEEAEIEPPKADVQGQVFAEDEPSWTTTEAAAEANGQAKQKTEETIFCDACSRCRRVGQELPKRCPFCKERRAEAKKAQEEADAKNPWKALKQPRPRKVSGGHCTRSIGIHLRAVLRHVDNMLKDFGFWDEEHEKVIDTPLTAEFRKMLSEAAHKLKEERDRLKAEAQRAQQTG